MIKSNHSKKFEPNEPVLKCGCGSVPLIRSHKNGVLRFRMYCPECGIETALFDSCEIAFEHWNVAMADHESVNGWCSLYDDRGDNFATELAEVESIIKKHEENSNKKVAVVEQIEDYINAKMPGHFLNENGRNDVHKFLDKYSIESVIKAVDISCKQYLIFDGDKVTDESATEFLAKLGGILYNMHRSPIEQEVAHIKAYARQKFEYLNENVANTLLQDYIFALRKNSYTDSEIIADFQTELKNLVNKCQSWSSWKNAVQYWIDYLNGSIEEPK